MGLKPLQRRMNGESPAEMSGEQALRPYYITATKQSKSQQDPLL